jgi:hypothetical protein
MSGLSRLSLPRGPETGTRYSVGSFLHASKLVRHMARRSFERLFGTQNGSEMGHVRRSRGILGAGCVGDVGQGGNTEPHQCVCLGEALPIVPALYSGRGVACRVLSCYLAWL